MKQLLLIALLLIALPLAAQEATPEATPETGDFSPLPPEATPEATAEPAPAYAWCGYLVLEWAAVGEDELALLASLFPVEALPHQLMQWRPNPTGLGGILEGCHILPVLRERVVSLLAQASGMDYAQLDGALQLTLIETDAEMLAYLAAHAAEWESEELADEPAPEATAAP